MMMWIFGILLGGAIIFLTAMGIAFRKAPQDPYEQEDEERFFSEQQNDSQVHIITDDGEEDEELDEDLLGEDNEDSEDQI